MRKLAILWMIVYMVMGGYAHAKMPVHTIDFINPYVPNYKHIGTGTLKWTFIKVYDVSLYVSDGGVYTDKPFALQLTYALNIKGTRIVKQTITEIQKQGFKNQDKLDMWTQKLQKIIPDVTDGVSLTGVYTATGETVFFRNDMRIGTISDTEFGRRFFDIWLGKNTREPQLRKALLGG